MSALTRRTVLKGSALAGAVAAVPAGAAALKQAGLVVFDSRLPESLAFARMAGALRTLDLASEHDAHFATIRSGVPQSKSLEGLTRWSDWVALRSELESHGWRVTSEQVAAPRQRLLRWSMARR